jgi:hypothetical protein
VGEVLNNNKPAKNMKTKQSSKTSTKYTITTLWLILAFVGMSVAPLWADIVIVESRTGGQNYASYSESTGGFPNSWSNASGKSTAPGCSATSIGSRFNSSFNVGGATAYFQVSPTLLADGGVYEVAVTTCNEAGSAVTSTITAPDGGWTGLPATTTAFSLANAANQWAVVGMLQLNYGTKVATVRFDETENSDRFYADAVRFTQVIIQVPDGIAGLSGAITATVTAHAVTGLSAVKVYDASWNELGTASATTAGAVVVSLNRALVNGETIRATQVVTLGGNNYESLHDGSAASVVVGVACSTTLPTGISAAYADYAIVTVSGCAASATAVLVKDDVTVVGQSDFVGGSTPSSVAVICNLNGGLVAGHAVKAYQVIGGVESCSAGAPSAIVAAQVCSSVPALLGNAAINGPLAAGQTTVHIVGVDPLATNVIVLANGLPTGTNRTTTGGGGVDVTVTALVKGDYIGANQIIGGVESCTQLSGPIVGGGANPNIRVCLDLQDSVASKRVWLPATDRTGGYGSAPVGATQVIPSNGWQTLTFAPNVDPQYEWNELAAAYTFTNAVAALQAIWFACDDADDTGPYEIYIDNIVNGTNVCGFEQFTNGSGSGPFSIPAGTGVGNTAKNQPPLFGGIVSSNADVGAKCAKVYWQYKNTGTGAGVANSTRLTVAPAGGWSTTMDLTQPITVRILVLPVGVSKPGLSISQPVNTTITNGIAASVTITATDNSGSGTLAYQWKRSGTNLVGVTSSALGFPTPSPGDVGTYSCEVTNTVASGPYAGTYTSECQPFAVSYSTGVTPSTTNAVLSVSNNLAGAQMIVENIGTPKAVYYVVTSTNLAAALNTWTPVTGSTNSADASTGKWTFTAPTVGAQRFYRAAAVNPAP